MFYVLEDIFTNEDLLALEKILGIYLLLYSISFLVVIIQYVFKSIGLFKMSKNLGFKHSWMAWVPYCNTYLFGKIASKYVKKDGNRSAKFGKWLLGLSITCSVLTITALIAVVFFIFELVGYSFDISNSASFEIQILSFILKISLFVFINCGVAIAYSVVNYVALWRLFAIYDSSTATVFLVLSILFPVTTPFFIFALRNNRPCLTFNERIGYYPNGQYVPVTETVTEQATVSESEPIGNNSSDE